MMRNRLVLLALLLGWAGTVHARDRTYTLNAQSVTDTGVSITFYDNGTGGDSKLLVAQSVFIKNDGASNEVFCNLGTRTATTSDFKILSGEGFWFHSSPLNTDGGYFGIGCIASSGETTTIRVHANPSDGGSATSAAATGASGGTAAVDNTAFTPGTTNYTPIGAEVDDTGTTAATENSAGVARMTVQRAIHVNLRDNAGAELAVGGGTQYDEDTVSTAADKLNMAGVVRKDTAATLAGTDGDRTQLQVDATGRLYTNPSGVTQPVSAASLPLPTGASTLAEQQTQTTALQIIDNLPVAQGSTTSGQSGALLQGAVTTAAPSYTTAQTSPLSLTTAGSLRVDIAAVTAVGQVDDAAFTVATSEVTPIGGCVTSDSADSGDAACIKITTDRKQVIVGGDAAGSPTAGQVITVQGIASMTKLLVTPDSVALPANQSVNVAQINGVTTLMGNGASGTGAQRVTIANDSTGIIAANIIAGQTGVTAGAGAVAANTPRMTHASDDPLVTLLTTMTTAASGLKYNSVGSTEDEHAVKASAGTLYSIVATNTNAAVRFLRCANAVAGSTTPGTTTPVIDLAIPGATTGAGLASSYPLGFAFSTGLTCWLVTGAADTDVAEVAANELKVFYTFK